MLISLKSTKTGSAVRGLSYPSMGPLTCCGADTLAIRDGPSCGERDNVPHELPTVSTRVLGKQKAEKLMYTVLCTSFLLHA